MGMNPVTGEIRALSSADELKENEVLFSIGEQVELKACKFEVTAIDTLLNQITLKGVPKDKGLGAEEEPPPRKSGAMDPPPPGA